MPIEELEQRLFCFTVQKVITKLFSPTMTYYINDAYAFVNRCVLSNKVFAYSLVSVDVHQSIYKVVISPTDATKSARYSRWKLLNFVFDFLKSIDATLLTIRKL